MTKNQIIAEHVVVTFFEGVIGYLTVNQTNLSTNWKTVAIGAIMFGLSLVYNLLRQSTPTLLDVPTSALSLPPSLGPIDTPPVNPVQ